MQTKPKYIPTFIITYNPHNPELRKWLKEVHFILLADRKLAKIYPHPPSVTFRQPKNLKQILCRNTLKNLPYRDGSDLGDNPPGCFKYSHGGRGRKCLLCPRLKEGRQFTSTYTGLTYNVKHNLTCKICDLSHYMHFMQQTIYRKNDAIHAPASWGAQE